MLDEVTITSGRIQNVKSTQLGAETLRPTQLKNIPMALGEVDILKMVQALPGVKTVGEASSWLQRTWWSYRPESNSAK